MNTIKIRVFGFMVLLSLVNTIFATPARSQGPVITSPSILINFNDLSSGHWAYNYVSDMINNNWIKGYPDNKFRPDKTISRAELATLITSVSDGKPKVTGTGTSSFNDVKITDWFSPYVEAAKDYLTGYSVDNGKHYFYPNLPATREDTIVAVVKLKGNGANDFLMNKPNLIFKDTQAISPAARDYVELAVYEGYISGYQDGTFRPKGALTRAEACTILWRAFVNNTLPAVSTPSTAEDTNASTTLPSESGGTPSSGGSPTSGENPGTDDGTNNSNPSDPAQPPEPPQPEAPSIPLKPYNLIDGNNDGDFKVDWLTLTTTATQLIIEFKYASKYETDLKVSATPDASIYTNSFDQAIHQGHYIYSFSISLDILNKLKETDGLSLDVGNNNFIVIPQKYLLLL